MTEAARTLAVDLGGTRMRAAVVTADGVLSSRATLATPQQAECPDALMDLAGEVLATGDVGHAVIVLGGGVGRNGDLFVGALRAHLDGHGPPGLPVPIDVRVAELGDDAGLAGAGAWRRATRGFCDG